MTTLCMDCLKEIPGPPKPVRADEPYPDLVDPEPQDHECPEGEAMRAWLAAAENRHGCCS